MKDIEMTYAIRQFLATLTVLTLATCHVRADVTTYNFENLIELPTEWQVSSQVTLESDGLHVATPTSAPAAAIATIGDLSSGWSIRSQGRLLQPHGFFGLAITPTTSGVNSGISIHTADGYVQLEQLVDAVGTLSPQLPTDFDFVNEDVIFQLDTFDGMLRFWAWKPGGPLPSDDQPLLEAALSAPAGYAGLWARSNDGSSAAVFRYAMISDEHIPIPEPSTGILFVLGSAVSLSIFRRHRSGRPW